MNMLNNPKRLAFTIFFLTIVFGFTVFHVSSVRAHGGEDHAEDAFTALQAVQKAITLYDRLVVSGKLPGVWETGLKTISVRIQQSGNDTEFVVKFTAEKTKPDSVYFFFDQKGEYSGSNFTGE